MNEQGVLYEDWANPATGEEVAAFNRAISHFAVGDMVTFLSQSARIEKVEHFEENGYRWTMLSLKGEAGQIMYVDECDLDESLAMRFEDVEECE